MSFTAETIAALSLADSPTYVELTRGTAGTVIEVTIDDDGGVAVKILVTDRGSRGDDEFTTETNSPTRTYITVPIGELKTAKRPPNT